jgi:hypothetical protein
MYTRLTAPESAQLLTGKLRACEPFLHLRYGDGAIECMAGHPGGTRDGEKYTPALAAALKTAWDAAIGPNVYIGDWLSASFDDRSRHAMYEAQYAALVGNPAARQWIHFEALLLMRESAELIEFYHALKMDRRKKLIMGPMPGAAKMLGAQHLATPMTHDLHAYFLNGAPRLWDQDFEVLLYGAGMAGQVQVVECWKRHPERTYINLGSGLDPLFRGKTRQQQIDTRRARLIFKGLM